MISVIKQVEGVRFDNIQKRWTLPTSNLQNHIEKYVECDIPYTINVNKESLPRSNSPVLHTSFNIQPRKFLKTLQTLNSKTRVERLES